MERSTVRVLVVDDYEPWRRFVVSTLQQHPRLAIVGEVSDGLVAVQKAQELQPDLAVIDLGLPTLNGIEAARRIHERAPKATILFLSENRSWDIAEEAFRTGACGYVVKSDAASDLLPAVEAVLQGTRFVSASLPGHDLTNNNNDDDDDDPRAYDHPPSNKVVELIPLHRVEIAHHHEVGFYSDDIRFLDHLTRFIGTALKEGNAAVVVATESHRQGLLATLQRRGFEIDAAIEQGRYIALDAAYALSTFMRNGMLDPVLFMQGFSSIISTAVMAARVEHPRVALFGEGANLLWARGNAEAAIQDEKLCNQLTMAYDLDILCGYCPSFAPGGMETHIYQQICAEHSAIHSW